MRSLSRTESSTMRVLLFLALLVAAVASYPMGCPNVDDLSPCSCKRYAFGLHVTCANFNTSSILVRALRILRDYRVHTVLLHRLYFKDILPSDLFTGMQIKEIKVEGSELKFSQPAFTGLDSSLYILNVAEESRIKSEERFSLAKLTKLNELYVQRNKLKSVSDKWLNEKVPNVQTVVLDYNEISEIQSHAFSSLEQLKVVSMADNRIKDVQRSMFPQPAMHLTRIDISFNELRSIPADFFFQMPNLKEVVLTQNELTTLPEATWIPVWEQLSLLLLYENKFVCDDKMKWIKGYHRPLQLDGNCVAPKQMIGKSIKEIYNKLWL